MKINKYFLGLAVILLGGLTSCETDAEGPVYTPMGQSVSFETGEPSTIKTSESSIMIPVRVVRAITDGAYTANYTVEASDEGIFTDSGNGSVSFADGEGVAVITVNANNLAKGKDYTYTMTFSEKEVATADTITKSQNIKTVIKIHSDYNWVSAGTCLFVDYTFSESDNGDAKDGIAIRHAEGTNLYEIVNPYGIVYDDDPADNIPFYLNADNSIKFGEGIIANVWGYGIYFDYGDFAEYCTVSQEGNIFQVNHLLLVGQDLYTGSFAFQWKGWPGE